MKKFGLLMMSSTIALGIVPHVMAETNTHSAHGNMTVMKQVSEAKDVYVCPMHPHIKGEHGDDCPICGMALVPAKTDDALPADSNISAEDLQGSHRVDVALMQKIGVKTAAVKLEVFGDDIRAFGRVVPSTRVENNVVLRVEGWVENLSASAAGDVVKKGDHLFDINSPQLVSAQTDYLTARQLENDDIAKAAEKRLRQLGVGDKALKLVQKQEEALSAVPFYASSSGIVTKLNIRAGDYIKPAQHLLSIQDLSTVWVEADVSEKEISGLKQGDRTMIKIPDSGKKRLGKIAYIHPVVDPKTRTGQVRIELRNPKGTLKPDSFVDVLFTAEKRHRLAVPAEAVLRSSKGSYVLRYLGDGRFKPIMVRTGMQSEDFVEIKGGLEAGQQIVTSGQFLFDAEASLKSGMGSMAGHDHGVESSSDSPSPKQKENPHAGH